MGWSGGVCGRGVVCGGLDIPLYFPGGSSGRQNTPANAETYETWVRALGLEDSLE